MADQRAAARRLERAQRAIESSDGAGKRRTSMMRLSSSFEAPVLTEKVQSMWAQITEASRRREMEAAERRMVEAKHEDMVEQLKIRVSSKAGGMIIIGDRRSSNNVSNRLCFMYTFSGPF